MSRRLLLVLVGLALAVSAGPARAQLEPPADLGGSEPPAKDAKKQPVPAPGERTDPERPGVQKYKYWEEEGVTETVVDEGGAIYGKRPYGGVIPNVRDSLRDKKTAKVRRRGPIQISWVGFQQKALFSRVFVQTDRLPTYTIFKPDPLHIVVEFPTARLRTRQEARHILTHEFNTPVDRVVAKKVKGRGIHVVITLKEPMGYLYKQEGDYVFIDVERPVAR